MMEALAQIRMGARPAGVPGLLWIALTGIHVQMIAVIPGLVV